MSKYWVDYAVALGGKDVSIDGYPLAITPQGDGVRAFGYGPRGVPLPGEAELHAIDAVAKRESVQYALIESWTNATFDMNHHGYAAAHLSMWVIDFGSCWEEAIRPDARRRIRQLTAVVDVQRGDAGDVAGMRKMKAEEVGRELWPDAVWALRESWARSGLGLVTKAVRRGSGEILGYWYTGMFPMEPFEPLWSAVKPNLRPQLAMGYALARGTLDELCRDGNANWVRFGQAQFGWRPYDAPERKHINISKFKERFGGNCRTLYRWEKFFDHDYAVRIAEERLSALRASRNANSRSAGL